MSTVDGHRLVLELTEHVHVDEYRHYEAALMRLRRSGIRLAIDDAGAGHSSMRHIIHMAPEIIKLDRSLTSMVDVDPIRKSLVAALVTFAVAIEATVIAEGIERLEEASALTAMGVACGQGWLYRAPCRSRRLSRTSSSTSLRRRSDRRRVTGFLTAATVRAVAVPIAGRGMRY